MPTRAPPPPPSPLPAGAGAAASPTLPPAGGIAGLVLGVAVAASFASGTTLARLAYDGGSNAITVLTVRTAIALAALLAVMGARRRPVALPGARAAKALVLGAVLAAYSYGVLGAIQYTPVAVVVVSFYTYPLFTALGSALTGRGRLSRRTVVALVSAFVGLFLVADVRGASFDPLGVGLAVGSAVMVSGVLLVVDGVRGTGDSRPVTLHMLVAALACYAVACVASGEFRLPATSLGWVGFLGAGAFYSFSITCLFVVVRRVGPVRSALVMNFEPVSSAVLGYVVLGQALSPLQVLGIAIVLGAVLSLRLGPRAVARAAARLAGRRG